MDPANIIKKLTPRERELMEVVYKLGEATAVDVMEHLPGSPNNATVRSMLKVLVEKGSLQFANVKGVYLYRPTVPLDQVRKSALDYVMSAFFEGAEASAVLSILKRKDSQLSDEDRKRIMAMIEEIRVPFTGSFSSPFPVLMKFPILFQ